MSVSVPGIGPMARHRRGRTLKSVVAVMLIVFVAVAAVPAGSNRPVFWALNGALVAVMATIYFAGVFMSGASVRLRWVQAGVPLVLLALVLAYLIVQAWPLGGQLAAMGLSWAAGPISGPSISLAPGSTLLMALQFGTYGLAGLLMLQVCQDRGRAVWVMHGLFYVITAHAAYALLALTQLGDTLLILQKWAYVGDATGTYINRNSFATLLAFGLMIGLGMVLRKLDALRQSGGGVGRMRGAADWPGVAILLTCMLVQAAALVATTSRLGAVSAASGGTICLIVYLSRDRGTRRAQLSGFLLAALAAGGGAIWLYGGGLVERLGSLQQDADVRGALYEQVVGMISQRPLLGYGGGAFEITFPFFHRLPVSPDLIWDKAHSTYLALWAELGLVFGTLPMLIVALAALRLWLVARSRHRDWAMPLVGLSVIVVAAVHSVADFSLEIQANAIAFVAIVAVAMATPTRAQQRR